MNALESRKKLLIAESELNRAQLARDWQLLAGEVRALNEQARTIRSLAAAATSLIAGLSSCRRKGATPPGGKLPWWQLLIKGASLVSSCWSESGGRPKS